jgi:hypothetical protein
MIRVGQREFEVPLWLWAAVPLAFVMHAAYGSTIYGIDTFNPDGFYLSVVRQCAAASLAGFLLIDLIRRSSTPWYGLPFLWLVSFAASSLAVGWLSTSLTEMVRTLVGLAISVVGSRGGTGVVGLALWAVMLAALLFSGLMLALVFTFASRLLVGLPLWTGDTRREFWANLGGAFLWLAVASGGYVAIRFSYGLALGVSASVVPRWLPLAAAILAASAATAVHLWVAYRFRRRQSGSRHGIKIWMLAVVCAALIIYRPDAFGYRVSQIGYDYVRPVLRAVHLLPSPVLSVAAYEVDVPFHDFKTRHGVPMPDGKASYLYVPLPSEYGLTSATSRPSVSIYRRDITPQQVSTYWTDRRKALEEMQAKEPGKDAVVRSPGPRGSLALRSDQYPDVDFSLADFDPAISSDLAEQALRRFMLERLRRTN